MISKKQNCINISGTQEEQDLIDIMYELDDIIALSKLCEYYKEIVNSNEEHFLYSKKEAASNLKTRIFELSAAISAFNTNKREAQKRVPILILEGSNVVNLFYYPE